MLAHSNPFLFVYGTLLQGKHRHQTLITSELITSAHTKLPYLMQNSGFPMVFEVQNVDLQENDYYGQIKGEIYKVNSQTQEHLDQIEGVPNLYFRKDVFCIDPQGKEHYPYMYITQPVHFNKIRLFTVNAQGFHNYAIH